MNPEKIAAYRKLYAPARGVYAQHVSDDVYALLDEIEALQSPAAPEHLPDGWTLIDSEQAAQAFSGKWVEVHAPAVTRLCGEHQLHTRICRVSCDPDQPAVELQRHLPPGLNVSALVTRLNTGKGDSILWQLRGNVKLREVPNPETPNA